MGVPLGRTRGLNTQLRNYARWLRDKSEQFCSPPVNCAPFDFLSSRLRVSTRQTFERAQVMAGITGRDQSQPHSTAALRTEMGDNVLR